MAYHRASGRAPYRECLTSLHLMQLDVSCAADSHTSSPQIEPTAPVRTLPRTKCDCLLIYLFFLFFLLLPLTEPWIRPLIPFSRLKTHRTIFPLVFQVSTLVYEIITSTTICTAQPFHRFSIQNYFKGGLFAIHWRASRAPRVATKFYFCP